MLLLLETMSMKDGLDFFQTTGLFSALGWTFRQFLVFRDLKAEVKLLNEWKVEQAQTRKEELEKQEEKELQREVIQQQILTEVRELAFDVRSIKEKSDVT